MNQPLSTPILTIDNPSSGDHVMPDFSVSGTCTNWSAGLILCELKLQPGKLSNPPGRQLPQSQLCVEAAVSSVEEGSVRWEANFNNVPPGEYRVTASFESPDNVNVSIDVPDNVSIDITVDDYNSTNFSINHVMIEYPTNGDNLPKIRICGRVPVTWGNPEGDCFLTFQGRKGPVTSKFQFIMHCWQALVDLPERGRMPYTLHAQVIVDKKRFHIARRCSLIRPRAH